MKVVPRNLPAGCGSVGPKPDHTNKLTQVLVSIDKALQSLVASTPQHKLFDVPISWCALTLSFQQFT